MPPFHYPSTSGLRLLPALWNTRLCGKRTWKSLATPSPALPCPWRVVREASGIGLSPGQLSPAQKVSRPGISSLGCCHPAPQSRVLPSLPQSSLVTVSTAKEMERGLGWGCGCSSHVGTRLPFRSSLCPWRGSRCTSC